MTKEEKEKIDYEIRAKKEAKELAVFEWGCAGFLAFIIFAIFYCFCATMSRFF